MPDEVVISVANIGKVFKLPHEKTSSVKSLVVNFYRRKRTYEIQQALQDVSFEIKKGEFFGIVGRNGSGKSTLLKILAGIYRPTEGNVQTKGKIVPFIELGVGFNPELTGRDNVFLNGALLGFSNKEMKTMYHDIVEFAELEKFMDQRLKNYSSGMEVRLAFSLAIRAKADILLIDEVLAVGDADFQRKCFNYFNQLRGSDTTVVFVSHDMGAIREYCDRALLIEDSKILAIGSTDEVTEKYLRLFMKDEKIKPTKANGEQNRWGDYSLKIKSVDIKVEPNNISIKQVVEAHKSMPSPVIGFRIREASGKDLMGTNTKIENKKLPDLKRGQEATVIWKMPNLLADGDYTLDPSVLHADELTVADWWNEAATFTVKKNRHLPYRIDPGFDIDVVIKGS
ncbi:MAG TPA: ABC transporter ATP-binding protein [Candidatus Saccharimonadales bacterium]|nr:ABC transporter ATP-binding protein [Candidatus Saccharimonadales bacterium]